MDENVFVRPEKPYLIHYEDLDGNAGWSWIDTEDTMLKVVSELKQNGMSIKDIVEVGSLREIQID